MVLFNVIASDFDFNCALDFLHQICTSFVVKSKAKNKALKKEISTK